MSEPGTGLFHLAKYDITIKTAMGWIVLEKVLCLIQPETGLNCYIATVDNPIFIHGGITKINYSEIGDYRLCPKDFCNKDGKFERD